MKENNHTVFLIERMQPSWLESKAEKRLYSISVALTFGLSIGLAGGGGLAVIQHFALRFVLRREDLLPLKLVTFLDYAAERIFLHKVGGGYVFVHRMLMDYFADLEPGPVDR